MCLLWFSFFHRHCQEEEEVEDGWRRGWGHAGSLPGTGAAGTQWWCLQPWVRCPGSVWRCWAGLCWRREEELGRAVPSRCGEPRAGRQLEAVPPPCSISVDGGAGVKQGFVPLSPTLQPMYRDRAWEDLLPLLQDSPAH